MIEQDLSHIRQGFDHVGELYAKLRDLRGYDTLANELLQNADDAGATKVIFDVCDGFLMVENNSVFKDCGDLTQYECS